MFVIQTNYRYNVLELNFLWEWISSGNTKHAAKNRHTRGGKYRNPGHAIFHKENQLFFAIFT